MDIKKAKPKYIDDDDALKAFVQSISKARVLAIDTEFIREKTYYPNLCLIQLATDDELAIVDPFSVRDLSPLKSLIQDDAIVKLFHAAGQDLEIINHELGLLPTCIYDVQVAASLLGQSQQAGLASIVSTFLGISIKKSDSFTDWSRRPLTPSQIKYAAEDVIFLPALYDETKARLASLGRIEWLENELKPLCDPAKYTEDPFMRYKRLKRGNQLSRKQLAAARELCAWREREAQQQDVPRKWILTDEQIVESCKREPKNIDELFLIRGIRNSLSTRAARTVVELMRNAYNSDPSTWPTLDVQAASEKNVDAAVDLLTAYIRKRSKEVDVAMQTLASHQDLVQVARGHFKDSAVMSGWRKELLGEDIVKILEGRCALKLNGSEIDMIAY